MPEPESIPKVFLCYAREDNDKADPLRGPWLDRLRLQLKRYEGVKAFKVFADVDLKAGDAWDAEIRSRLEHAAIVVVLVSDALLASDYVREKEMPIILARAARGELKVVPVILNHCGPGEIAFEFTDAEGIRREAHLTDFQTMGSPERPLLDLAPPEQSKLLSKIAETVYRHAQEVTRKSKPVPPSPPAEAPPAPISSGHPGPTPKLPTGRGEHGLPPTPTFEDRITINFDPRLPSHWKVAAAGGILALGAVILLFLIFKPAPTPSVNTAPVMASLDPITIDELLPWTFTLSATDTDVPPQTLTYGLVSGPTGLAVSPTGVVTWTPTEAQGPSFNTVVVKVTDDGLPPSNATTQFEVVVQAAAPTRLTNSLTNSLGMVFVPVAGTEVWFSIWETRVRDYEAYAQAIPDVDGSWKDPQYQGIAVTPSPDHPVVNVSWTDATNFCAWLTKKERVAGRLTENQTYRLPKDVEWSTAVGLPDEQGATPADRDAKNPGVYPWGTKWPPANDTGNYADESFNAKFPGQNSIPGYRDGFATTSPVGSFPLLQHGLCDLSGNVWEWCEDWYDAGQKSRVLRGGSWNRDAPADLLSSSRGDFVPGGRYNGLGFRVVLVGAGSAR